MGFLPVSAFERLSQLLCDHSGDIAVKLSFRPGRKKNALVVGHCDGTVLMTCQNCLEPVAIEISAAVRNLLVATVEQLVALDPTEDGIVCSEDKIRLVDLIEDDLLVPRHKDGDCVEAEGAKPKLSPAPKNTEGSLTETYKPFKDLADLTKDLKRS